MSPVPAAERWWNDGTTAVCTGANKGIGYEIAGQLAAAGLRTVVAARNPQAGADAAERLQRATGTPVLFHQLDITDEASVRGFVQWARVELGQITVLVNNAGMAFKGNTFGASEARQTIDTNYRGTARVSAALVPLLPSDGTGRVVNVCSSAGKLSIVPNAALRRRFEEAASAEQLDALADQFVEAIRAGTHAQQGWPSSMYGVSKLLEASYTRVLASSLKETGVMVNACCPGWCATDMSSGSGPKSPAEGANTPVWLALRPPTDFVTGAFFSDCQQEPF